MFWHLLCCVCFWAGFLISVNHRNVCSSVSEIGIKLHKQNATVADGNASVQLLQHPGNLREAQGLCLICVKVLFKNIVDLHLLPWCIPPKPIWINTQKILLRFYILGLPFSPCTICTCIHTFCCLHSALLSAVFTVHLRSLLTGQQSVKMMQWLKVV